MRGYFGIGIVGSKTPLNVGTLWRSAGNMGAAFIFTVGRRYPRQGSDTIKAWKHIPLFELDSLDDLRLLAPSDCVPVGIEQAVGARRLPGYTHPERAIYLLGAEDTGLTGAAMQWCRDLVEIPSSRCLNVAVAGSIVMYDRAAKQGAVAQSVEHRFEKPGVAGSNPARPIEAVA